MQPSENNSLDTFFFPKQLQREKGNGMIHQTSITK